MINKLQHTLQWLKFYLKAANSKGHGTHSPFVYHFITEILNDNRNFYAFQEIESLRKELLRAKRSINYNGKETNIRSILNTSIPTKYNQLLFRMVDFYKPSNVLEIGGSLGISTAYLASPDKTILVHTIEEENELSLLTQQTLKNLALNNATCISKELLLRQGKKYGLVLINQSSWESEEIIQDLSPFVEEESVLIFTGINKSLNKKILWDKIVEQSMKTFSITLFDVGIIFFSKDVLKKQYFAIRF